MGEALFRQLDIPDSYTVDWPVHSDRRGHLIKVFATGPFENQVPGIEAREIFYSSSPGGVLRGMHFQDPSLSQWKIVSVLSGTVLDVLVDLRPSSPTFGRNLALTLREGSGLCVVVPPGVAHGFFVESTSATTLYAVSSEYEPDRERGIRFDSFGFKWPVAEPTLSDRDLGLPTLSVYAEQIARSRP